MPERRHRDLGDALQEAERPGDGDARRGRRAARRASSFSPRRASLPPQTGLHDPHGDAPLAQEVDLAAGVLELPVEVVDLKLAELHVLAVRLEEALHTGDVAVGREAQVTDAPRLLLREQVVEDAVRGGRGTPPRSSRTRCGRGRSQSGRCQSCAAAPRRSGPPCPCWPGRIRGTCPPGSRTRAGGGPARARARPRTARRGSPHAVSK